MIDKIRELVSGENRNIRERLFVIICLEGIAAAIGSLIECILIGSGWMSLAAAGLTLIIIPCALVSVVNNGGQELPIAAVTVWLNLVVFPVVFFNCGGVHSGSNCWMAMGILYTFMVYRGKPLVIFASLTAIVDIACYAVAYYMPETVKPLGSEAMVYVDSAFGLLAAAVAAGLVFSYRRKGYGKESARAVMQRNEINRINASRERFYANFSHEIRNPINAIVGLNELNIRNATDPEIRKNSQAIARSGKLLLGIVNDIMDLSQVEDKSMQLAIAPYESANVISQLVEIVSTRVEKKGLEFIVEIDPSMPKVLIGDERRVMQILLNILTNAVKYTEEGHVKMAVECNKTDDGNVLIRTAISDTGIGIEKENLEHLFETYSQFDRINNNSIEGNGLGLPIAYQMTKLMGGQVLVDSVYGKGSIFTIELTQGYVGDEVIEGTTYEEISRNIEAEDEYTRSFEASGAKILVVDDDEQNRVIIKGLLKETKVEVYEASSGVEALALTAQNTYNIILVDYMMPGMSGTELLEAIKTQPGGLCKDSVIIALTGANLDDRDQSKAMYKFDMILNKPVEYAVLEAAIADSLPEELIEYRDRSKEVTTKITCARVMPKKKRRVRITTESICDLPMDVLNEHDIGLMYMYIRTPRGRFRDVEEIDTMDLMGKLTDTKREVYPDGATVAEYEEFFRNELESSEEIIHLSFTSKMGESCSRSMEAAKSFSHVRVIDSGSISSGLGLLALIASNMTESDMSVDEICHEIQKMSKSVEFSFVLPSSAIYAEFGKIAQKWGEMYDMLNLHPAINISGGSVKQVRVYRGDMESIIPRHIRATMALGGRMDTRFPIIVTHVGLPPRAQDQMMREMKRNVPDSGLMLTRASVSSAGNIGMGAMGIAYLRQSRRIEYKQSRGEGKKQKVLNNH